LSGPARTARGAAVLLAAVVALVACAGAPRTTPQSSAAQAAAPAATVPPTRVLLSGIACGRTDPAPAVSRLDDADDLARVTGQLGRSAPNVELQVPGHGSALVLIELGQKRTAGYGLGPGEPLATISGATLEVHVRTSAPGPEQIVAQVLTSPCLLLEIGSEAFEQVRVLDQDGGLVVEASVR